MATTGVRAPPALRRADRDAAGAGPYLRLIAQLIPATAATNANPSNASPSPPPANRSIRSTIIAAPFPAPGRALLVVAYRNSVLVQLDRNPLEVGVLGWAVVTGVGRFVGLVFDPVVNVPPSALPFWLSIAWHSLLVVGGTVALVGAFWRDAITGVLVTRAAMWPLSAGGALYALGLAAAGQWRPATAVTVFAVTFGWRAAQITHNVRVVRRSRPGTAI